jgi:hypothetical protein
MLYGIVRGMRALPDLSGFHVMLASCVFALDAMGAGLVLYLHTNEVD